MANEIQIQTRLALQNGSLVGPNLNPGSKKVNQTTQFSDGGVISVPTSDTNLSALFNSGLTDPGHILFTNLSASNYVELGPTSGGAIVKLIKLQPGKDCLFELATGVTLRGIANTGAVKLAYVLYDK